MLAAEFWTSRENLWKLPSMRFMVILILGILLAGCQPQPPKLLPTRLSKELVVVMPNGPMTYYVNSQGEFSGPEYDLAKLFTEHLSKQLGEEVRLTILQADNIGHVISKLLRGKAHLAASNLSITHQRQHLVRFGPTYQIVQQQIVYNKDLGPAPKSLTDLAGKSLAVSAGTSFAERLSQQAHKYPQLKWEETRRSSSVELLEDVANGTLDYTVADSNLIAMERGYYPSLGVAFDFGPSEQLAWAFPKGGDEWLYQQSQDFFKKIQRDGRLRTVLDRYFGSAQRLNPIDTSSFLLKSRTLLPKYEGLFKQAQTITGLDWRLLAAIGYQESHWDPYATSPTNVRGLMMLTEETADRMGVNNRLDAQQSILAGAKYVVLLKDTLSARIPEPDRTWMALAAYNIGIAHLEDARVLAERLKLNPNSWADIKKTLPLLSEEEYFTTTKYGFARGGAPVVYVESIRSYYNMLQKHEPRHAPELLPDFNLVWARQLMAKVY
jgi:membrane-bound lytic murein transglycosylase F